MAPVVQAIEIAKPPEVVFGYIDQLDRHTEWQEQLVSVEVLTDGPTRVGSRAVETRRVPGGPRRFTYEITEHDPPRHVAWRIIEGPVRPRGSIVVEPVGDGSASRTTIELDFEGHGIGKLIAPLARAGARRQLEKDYARLKAQLEAGA